MKKMIVLMLSLSVMLTAQRTPAIRVVVPQSETISIAQLATPESVTVQGNMLYVSNLGDPDKARDGFILQSGLDGSKPKKLFDKKLDSPKGFAFISDTMIAIADQVNTGEYEGNVVIADVKSGRIINQITIKDSKFLNDVAKVNDTTVAVSDTGTGKIHLVTIEGTRRITYKELASNIPGANGITVFRDTLYVAGSTFGGDTTGGNIYTVALDGTVTKWTAARVGTGGLDGIAIVENSLYVSDWENGEDGKASIYIFDMQTKVASVRLQGGLTATADFDIKNGFIWLPEFNKNSIKKVVLQ